MDEIWHTSKFLLLTETSLNLWQFYLFLICFLCMLFLLHVMGFRFEVCFLSNTCLWRLPIKMKCFPSSVFHAVTIFRLPYLKSPSGENQVFNVLNVSIWCFLCAMRHIMSEISSRQHAWAYLPRNCGVPMTASRNRLKTYKVQYITFLWGTNPVNLWGRAFQNLTAK